MDRICIALVGATHARFFTFERVVDELGTHEQLIERADLVNPVRRPDAEFARTAMAALRELIDDNASEHVIICAGSRMLDKLRISAPGLLPEHLTWDELASDLVKLSPSELRAELVPHGLLPPRLLHSTPTGP